jgi:hypothetical protein
MFPISRVCRTTVMTVTAHCAPRVTPNCWIKENETSDEMMKQPGKWISARTKTLAFF